MCECKQEDTDWATAPMLSDDGKLEAQVVCLKCGKLWEEVWVLKSLREVQ